MTSDPREQRAREVVGAIMALMTSSEPAKMVREKAIALVLAHGLAERRAGMEECEAIAVDYLDRMLRSAAKLHPITGQYPNGIAECKADAAQTILDRIRALLPPLSPAAGKEE